MTQEETGKLIECREKNGKDTVEESKKASTMDGPEQGTDTGNQLFKGG